MPTAKPGPWLDTAMKKGMIAPSSSSANPSSVAAAEASGVVTDVPSAILEALDEAKWQEMVVVVAVSHGWKTAHCRKVKVKRGKREWWETTMPKGWFDLVLVRNIVMYVECKVRPNVRTPEQQEWADAMSKAGQRACLWYPEDWSCVREMLK